ncbi:MAG: hypothetical protein L6R36_007711, partial [Xanthoria steineri]
ENLLPSGPYFLYNDGIYEAWRLYPDDLDAFEVAVVLQDRYRPARWDQYTSYNQAAASWLSPARFSPLKLLDQEGLWKSIAVPSRLYAQKSRKHPLAGARISVKDNFKLAGIKTTMTNRAFTQLYPAEIETAEYVETLLRLGAIIVGKSKMCSFAAGENPGDWIDSHCPVNPRGDQYQSPGSSIAGGGASLAGYSWLDYSIGTDSESTDPWDHDTVGFLSRRLDSLQELVRDTTNLKEPKTLPTRTLYPKEFFPVANDEQQILLENYICVLESHLKAPRIEFSLVELWARRPPREAEGKSLHEYLGNSIYHQYYYDAYHQYDGFRKDYRDTYGREAYAGPLVRYRWPFSILEMLGENTLAMVVELPHQVLPVGQNSYESRASGRTEHRPVIGSLVGAKGSDLMLIKLAHEAFESAGWQTEVHTGRYTFSLDTTM